VAPRARAAEGRRGRVDERVVRRSRINPYPNEAPQTAQQPARLTCDPAQVVAAPPLRELAPVARVPHVCRSAACVPSGEGPRPPGAPADASNRRLSETRDASQESGTHMPTTAMTRTEFLKALELLKLSQLEAARRLGVSARTVRYWVAKKKAKKATRIPGPVAIVVRLWLESTPRRRGAGSASS